MPILRFIIPFLFVRNWQNGAWELSRPRLGVFLGLVAILIIGVLAAYDLQSPIEYSIEP
jgi:hypothetical protein